MSDDYEITVTVLDEDTCWRLLARAGFGRLGFADGDEIVVLPVNCGVHERRVVFRTGDDSSLSRLGAGVNVGFEVDHTDRVAESGWSVLVRGRLWDADDTAEAEGWSEFTVHPWAAPPRDRWMMIEPTQVTGRMIQRHRRLRTDSRVPYMPPD